MNYDLVRQLFDYLPSGHLVWKRSQKGVIKGRVASQSCNMRNCGLPSNNTSGVKGVNFHSQTRKWRAQVKAEGANKYLGI